MPLMVSEYSGLRRAASAGGVTGCIFQTGAILGPALLGLSIDITGSFQTVWWLVAAGPMMGIILLMPITKPQPVTYNA
jgi:cyanate permease